MKERKMRHHFAVRYLLVAAERHLPCRKGHKHHAARRKIAFQAFQETGLVVNMLYHIVHQYQGEFMLQFRQFENVGCDKSTFRPSLGKKLTSLGNASGSNVHSRHRTTQLREREQVTPFATPHFQHLLRKFRATFTDIRNIVFLCRTGLLVKITFAVGMALLHVNFSFYLRQS